jgi:hypothetical protein
MPLIQWLFQNLSTPSTDPEPTMTAIFLTPKFPTMIQPAQLGRNGQIDNALVEGRLRTDANLAMAYRTKEIFCTPGYAVPGNGASGSRDRWNGYCHSGPYAKKWRLRILMAKDNNTGAGHVPADCTATFSLYDTGGVIVGSALEFHYGANATTATDTPDEWQDFTAAIDVSPDTDYSFVVREIDYARIISCVVYEESLEPDTTNGYFGGVTSGQNIYSSDRENLSTALADLLRRGSASWIKWTTDTSTALTTISATFTNVVDNTSTAVTANTPGYYWDGTGRNYVTASTTGMAMFVYGRYTGAGKHGSVKLVNSAGSTVASIIDGWNPGAYAWGGVVFDMPLTAGKYDLQYATSAGTFDLLAVAVFMYTL